MSRVSDQLCEVNSAYQQVRQHRQQTQQEAAEMRERRRTARRLVDEAQKRWRFAFFRRNPGTRWVLTWVVAVGPTVVAFHYAVPLGTMSTVEAAVGLSVIWALFLGASASQLTAQTRTAVSQTSRLLDVGYDEEAVMETLVRCKGNLNELRDVTDTLVSQRTT